MMPAPKDIFSYRRHWAHKFGPAPFLPMSRGEMGELGWDSCDIILVTGDAYVDHPSFGMAVIGRTLEAQGFRVGIIAQPDWNSTRDFKQLGRPNLYFGVTAGNMDSMVNHQTAFRKRAAPALGRRLYPGQHRRPAAGPGHDRLFTALSRGLQRDPYCNRRHRGQPAPDRAFRLLAGEGATLGADGCKGRYAAVR